MSSAEQAVLAPHTGEKRWPARVGHYRLIAPIGGGSSGTVFRSMDERSGNVRALKLVSAVHRGQNAALGREFALVFQLCTRGLPGVVQALETGRVEGRAWYSIDSQPASPP